MGTIQGASWARLVRDDEDSDPEAPGVAWVLWRRKVAGFPHGEMGAGFRYVVAEGPSKCRTAEAIQTVEKFTGFRWVDNVAAAYPKLITAFGRAEMPTRLQWLNNGYNRAKIDANAGALLFAAWTYTSRRINAPVEPISFDGVRTGWKRLDP